MLRKERIERKSRDDINWMRSAGLVVAEIHAALRAACQPGVTTADLDDVSRAVIAKNGAKSNFLGYHGFPATICASVNEVVVHGIPNSRKLRAGDLISFDCGAYLVDPSGRQWHGDAAFTMMVGGPEAGSAGDRQLDEVTRQSLWAALAALKPNRSLGVVGNAVEKVVAQAANDNGWEAGIIEEYVGHGIGTQMHQPPDVPNYRVRGRLPKLRAGMVLAIEPMLTTGTIETKTLGDNWTVVTTDGSRAAHWEHTVAILPEGISVLTAPDCGVAGLAPFGITPVVLDGVR